MLANFYVFFMTMALLLLSITISWYNCHHSRDQSHSNSCFTMESFEMSGANYFPLSLLLSSKLQPLSSPLLKFWGWEIGLGRYCSNLYLIFFLLLFTYLYSPIFLKKISHHIKLINTITVQLSPYHTTCGPLGSLVPRPHPPRKGLVTFSKILGPHLILIV